MSANETIGQSIADREIVVTRQIDAPAHLLFEAWSRPEHLMRWFGPEGWPLTHCEADFRVGGRFRFAMTGESGVQEPYFGGQYLEIIPNEKIVYDNAFELPGSERMIVTVSFDESDDKTLLTVHTLFDSKAARDEHAELGYAIGLNSGLDNLVGLIATMR